MNRNLRTQESLIRMLTQWEIALAYTTERELHYRLPNGDTLHLTKPGPGVALQQTKVKIACRALDILPGEFWKGPVTDSPVDATDDPTPVNDPAPSRPREGILTNRILDVFRSSDEEWMTTRTIAERLSSEGEPVTVDQVSSAASSLVRNTGMLVRRKRGVYGLPSPEEMVKRGPRSLVPVDDIMEIILPGASSVPFYDRDLEEVSAMKQIKQNIQFVRGVASK